MLKKLYVKHFIFFVPLLTYSFYSYGMDLSDDRSQQKFYKQLKRQQILMGNSKFRTRVKDGTTFLAVISRSVKQGTADGTADALTRVTLNVISTVLQIIPFTVQKLISLIKIYAYKWSFGTTGLTGKDLTKFSNRIHSLCTPLATSQTGNMRKTQRANTIEGEQNNSEFVDSVWLKRRTMLIAELEHVVTFLKNELPCYNAAFQSIDVSLAEKQMAWLLYALSTENNNEIQHYIIRLIGYIKELIHLIESFSSFDNAVGHADETKALLNVIRLTFEHIASFLADGNAKASTGFQKMADDMSNKRDLMDILGNSGLK